MNKAAAKRIEEKYLKVIEKLFTLNNAGEELYKNFVSLVYENFKIHTTFDYFIVDVIIGELHKTFQIYQFTENFIQKLSFLKRLGETLLKYDFINERASMKLMKQIS